MRSIEIDRVKALVNKILDQLIADGITAIPLEHQMYWSVCGMAKYDLMSAPEQLSVGDLFDDLDFTESALRCEGAVATYTLTEIAPLLTYIGERAAAEVPPIA